MNENNNPYTNPEPAAPRAPQNAQPPVQQGFQQPQQRVYYAAPPANKPQPVRQAPVQPNVAQRQNTPSAAQNNKNSANTFGVLSFVIGCVLLLITPMIFFNFRSSWAEKYNYSMSWSILCGLPAVIFGAVALMKKPKNKLFPLLGIAFSVILMLSAFITYFIVMNSTDEMLFSVRLF